MPDYIIVVRERRTASNRPPSETGDNTYVKVLPNKEFPDEVKRFHFNASGPGSLYTAINTAIVAESGVVF